MLKNIQPLLVFTPWFRAYKVPQKYTDPGNVSDLHFCKTLRLNPCYRTNVPITHPFYEKLPPGKTPKERLRAYYDWYDQVVIDRNLAEMKAHGVDPRVTQLRELAETIRRDCSDIVREYSLTAPNFDEIERLETERRDSESVFDQLWNWDRLVPVHVHVLERTVLRTGGGEKEIHRYEYNDNLRLLRSRIDEVGFEKAVHAALKIGVVDD